MRNFHVRLFLLVIVLISPLSQQAQRTLNFGISSGVTQFYSSSSHSTNTGLLRPQANPILSGPFRYIAADAQLGVTPSFGISLGLGYNELIGSFEGMDMVREVAHDYIQPLYKSIFLEPGIIYMYQIDERLHLVSSLSSSLHFNISKNFRPDLQLVNSKNQIASDFQLRDDAGAYLTVNPSLELRSVATANLRVGFLVKYFQGLGTILNYEGSFYHNEIPEKYAASYSGSGLLLPLRISYCLACSN